MEFQNKVVLVTGSSSGIGEATAIEFVKLGARVVITGRNEDRLKLVEQKCIAAAAGNGRGRKLVLVVVADVTKDEDIRRLIDLTLVEFGQLDILINNAGAAQTSSTLDPKAVSAYDFTMSTNIRSVFVLTHMAIPHLIKTKGNIVNVSSVAGLKPIGVMSAYCMSKAALDMFTKCLALEVGPHGVRVNSVNCGGVLTNFGTAMGFPPPTPEGIREEEKNIPLGRLATPEDITPLITFLTSSKAANMTGSIVVSDGGTLWAPRPEIRAPEHDESVK